MDNQHRKITGYRELTQEEIDLMNEIKAKGEDLDALVKKVKAHVSAQHDNATEADTSDEHDRLLLADPDLWVWAAKGELQSGLMKLTRAVAQPTTF